MRDRRPVKAAGVLRGDVCTTCGAGQEQGRVFLARLGGGRLLCLVCWRAAGRPWPMPETDVQRIHEAELATRERMQARGGTDRHLVRKGLT